VPFRAYLAYKLINKNEYVNFNRVLFRENTSSLFMQMYQPDRDFELYRMLDLVHMKAIKWFSN
jgi:hypothetical protein